MSFKSKAEIIMAMEDYECEDRQRLDEGIDLMASHDNSDDRILLRIITEPTSKSGIIGINAVKKMSETLERENYDKGILISKRFTVAARQEMRRKHIRMISEKFMPSFEPHKIYLKIQDYVNNICKIKCGNVPEKESDCDGYSNGGYTCEVRVISDDASFHLKHGWTNLLQNDLNRILALNAHFEQSVI